MKERRSYTIEIIWGTSRGRDSYGYTTCSLRVDGKRRAYCNGGGYDMRGTVLGSFIASEFQEELNALKPSDMPKQSHWEQKAGKTVDDGRYFYGLRYIDPTYNPGQAKLEHADGCFTKPEDVGKTFDQLREEGKVVDLDVLRAAYKETSPHPTKRHTRAHIDGACGESSVRAIAEAIGYELRHIVNRRNFDAYEMTPKAKSKTKAA